MFMIDKKKVIAIIPARGGSKGIPRKNIKDLNGKPLIAYTIEEAQKSKYIDRIVVSTENEEIAQVSKSFGAEVPYLRPKELANDNSPLVECIIDMVNYLKIRENFMPDYVCVLQCTTPLRTFKDIDGAIEKIVNIATDGVVSVCEAEVNPYWTNVFDGDELKYFIEEGKQITRRQDLPKIYRINGAVYVVKVEILVNDRTLEPSRSTGFIMEASKSIDIDNIKDFLLAEILIKVKGGKK